MKLIAKKPCSFCGKKFYIGDEIPAEYVLNPREQEKMGVLATVDDQGHPAPALSEVPTAPGTITINIHAAEGDLPLEISPQELQTVFDVLTGDLKDAETLIGQMTDGDALILLHASDSRKTIKNAAEARAKALNTQESAGDE